jgi:Ser/Thr protein kinase RdoA (MazF antagonist)
MEILFTKQILIFTLIFQIISQPIAYKNINNIKINETQTLPLTSIFTDDADIVEVIASGFVQTLIDLYYQKKITDKDIEQLLLFYQDIARQTGKQDAFLKMQTGLMFRLHYVKLGKITEIKILIPGKNATPVKIVTNKGAYVFKQINQIDEGVNFKGVLKVKPSQYFVDFMKYLVDRGIPVANFIQKDDRSYLIHFGNIEYMCMEFKEGKNFMDGYTPFNIDTLFAQPYNKKMGELAARIYNAQKGFEKEHPEYLSDPALGDVAKIELIESFDPVVKAEIFNKEPKKKEAYLKFSKLIREQCEIFLRNYRALNKKNFRRGFIHSDINPGNVRFDGDKKVSGVFDFDFSHYDYRIAEFFNLIMCYKVPQTKFKDILTAYQTNLEEPLNEDEIRGIIEYVRFKHITTMSISYTSALEKFAADFSTEEQISAFVKETKESIVKSLQIDTLTKDSFHKQVLGHDIDVLGIFDSALKETIGNAVTSVDSEYKTMFNPENVRLIVRGSSVYLSPRLSSDTDFQVQGLFNIPTDVIVYISATDWKNKEAQEKVKLWNITHLQEIETYVKIIKEFKEKFIATIKSKLEKQFGADYKIVMPKIEIEQRTQFALPYFKIVKKTTGESSVLLFDAHLLDLFSAYQISPVSVLFNSSLDVITNPLRLISSEFYSSMIKTLDNLLSFVSSSNINALSKLDRYSRVYYEEVLIAGEWEDKYLQEAYTYPREHPEMLKDKEVFERLKVYAQKKLLKRIAELSMSVGNTHIYQAAKKMLETGIFELVQVHALIEDLRRVSLYFKILSPAKGTLNEYDPQKIHALDSAA